MKKTATIIIAIAILGIIGIYERTHAGTPSLVSPSETSAATSTDMGTSDNSVNTASYKDGTYIGDNESTIYGPVQISVVIGDGKIADVNFLQMPNDQPQSRQHTQDSEPLLKLSTLNKQSANIDFVSGATQTSEAYQQSLQSALDQASRNT